MSRDNKYILLNKPFGVLCQFTYKEERKTLASISKFQQDVYPVGRLDADSEGLVLLTNDRKLKHYLLEPKYQHSRTYLVQVEKIPNEEAINKLHRGMIIEGKKTLPAEIKLLSKEPILPPQPIPIRFRKNVPTSWIEITIFEGRNRQIRKMTAAVGHPTLRLVRSRIGPLSLGKLRPGEWRELTDYEIKRLLSSVLPFTNYADYKS